MNIDNVLHKFDYNHFTGELMRVLAGGLRSTAGTDCNGYLRSTIDGKQEYNHRIVWAHYYREQPPEFIDHIDGDRGNNSISNLRACTLAENQMNRKVSINNTTGYTGVTYIANRGKYKATIYKDNKPIYVGLFETAMKAHEAYESKKASI
jgi:hypothetical protein